MMTKLQACCLASVLLIAAVADNPAHAQRLSGSEIRAITEGKSHRGTGKRGQVFVFFFDSGGALRGSVTPPGGTRVARAISDQGTWSIVGGRLCMQWRKWRRGRKSCGPIFRAGGQYRYNNGVRFTAQ